MSLSRRRRLWSGKSSGQSATEFLVIFPVLILLVFGIIQIALLYQAKATLNHATMQAARTGALKSGNKSDMRLALARGLAPLFASEASPAGYANALAKATLETSSISNLTRLDILNPTRAALDDFGRTALDGNPSPELPNDTLNYRTTTPGSNSKISIQDANILHIRVSYCYRLIVPVIDRILYAAANAVSPKPSVLEAHGMSDPFGIGDDTLVPDCVNPLFRGPRIRIQSEAFIRMQSPFKKDNL
jgi:Flp pilus assembly protein TadG